MTTGYRRYPKASLAVFALTTLLLVGFLVLPAQAQRIDLLQAQTESAGAQLPSVTHNTWISGTPIPTAVVAPGGTAVLKGEIYVVGGVNAAGTTIADTQIYNPATNTWSVGVSLPATLTDGAAAVVKNVLYVIGGGSGILGAQTQTNSVWAYSPKTKTWSEKAAMPTARQSIGAAVEKNIIYVVGGYSSSGGRLNTVESYNPATDTWTEEAPLLVGKSEPSVGLVGATIVAVDGFTASGDTGDNEGYDVTTNAWMSLQPDPTGRNTSFGGAIGSQIYVAGGYQGGGALNLSESFKVSKNTWKTLAPMPQAAMFGGSAVYKGKLYCIGGSTALPGTVIDNVQVYQP